MSEYRVIQKSKFCFVIEKQYQRPIFTRVGTCDTPIFEWHPVRGCADFCTLYRAKKFLKKLREQEEAYPRIVHEEEF